MKKWFCFLLALGFSFSSVYAQDDDDWEYEEEAPKKKAAPKKAAKSSGEESESRMGFAANFGDGGQENIAFVYDMGGMEIGVGLRVRSTAYSPVGGGDEVTSLGWSVIPSFHYELGKGLLNYGLGVWISYSSYTEGDADPITAIQAFPNFYISAEWIKNVALRANAGILVDKPGDTSQREAQMNISLGTSVGIIFYFM
jgi:hypothetical protein